MPTLIRKGQVKLFSILIVFFVTYENLIIITISAHVKNATADNMTFVLVSNSSNLFFIIIPNKKRNECR
ncbi:hypothetical protein BCS99_18310 [Vibrio breoganii]|nr:hypothetical protein BCT98_18160 [Vibrio breoganii]PMO81545.1 hypothetical protein BCT02_18625 [Vibrio breoganii]PMO92301.1 hypothetical protein BCS99_18310 [Vibrio breoganii]